MPAILIKEATNSEGECMRLEFSPTFSWQAFILTGLPSRMANQEGKSLTLAKAIQTWNVSIAKRADALQTASVSQTIRKLLDAARDARTAATKTKPIPILQ